MAGALGADERTGTALMVSKSFLCAANVRSGASVIAKTTARARFMDPLENGLTFVKTLQHVSSRVTELPLLPIYT